MLSIPQNDSGVWDRGYQGTASKMACELWRKPCCCVACITWRAVKLQRAHTWCTGAGCAEPLQHRGAHGAEDAAPGAAVCGHQSGTQHLVRGGRPAVGAAAQAQPPRALRQRLQQRRHLLDVGGALNVKSCDALLTPSHAQVAAADGGLWMLVCLVGCVISTHPSFQTGDMQTRPPVLHSLKQLIFQWKHHSSARESRE